MQNAVPARVQLGSFEFDLKAGELFRAGRKVRLQEQPFQVLLMLVEHSGELVTLDEIKKKLWPNDTVVEFDHSIHTAIKKLRQALDDSADNPRYVETVARRGYRLIVPVECLESTPGDSSSSDAAASGVDGAAVPRQLVPTLIGKKVSHYRVLEIVGGGGMGVVYKAEDLKLGRRVALKFLPEELVADAVTLQRFEREARTASSLNHPNICTVYEFGEHEGQPFLVMELLEGETLREVISKAAVSAGGVKAQMPLQKLLDIAIQITEGLNAAHQKGMIHRDIKPANIFLTTQGQVKILDFGLAKLASSASEVEGEEPGGDEASWPVVQATGRTLVEHTLTRTGVAMGTAGYMSPEQVRGEQLDARSDLFSFGLILYEMATGQRAFSGNTAAILKNDILNNMPSPARDFNSAIPPKLEQILNKALEKDREKRYQCVAEMRADLKALKPEADGDGSQVPIRRRRKPLVAVALILVAGIAGGLFWRQTRKSIQLTHHDTFVLASFANSTRNPVFDRALQAALYNNLEQSPFFNQLNPSKVASTLQQMKRPPNEQLTIELAREVCLDTHSKAVVAGSIADAGNRYRIGLKAVECQTGKTIASVEAEADGQNTVIRALGQAGTQLRLRLGEPPDSVQKFDRPLDEALTWSVEALRAFCQGFFSAAGDPQAVSYYKRAVELDPNFALAHWSLALAYEGLNQGSLANQSYATAFRLRNRLNARDRLSLEATYYTDVTGELDKAGHAFEETIRSYPEHYYDHENLGTLYGELGRYQEDAAEERISLQIDPYSAASGAYLINANIALGQLEQAQSVFQEALARGLDDPLLHFSRYSLAFMQRDKTGMEEQIAWGTGKSKVEDVLFSQQSDTEAYYGRLGSARKFADRAVSSAQLAGAEEIAAGWRVNQSLREAEVGNVDRARQMALESLSMGRTRDVKVGAALVLARTGDAAIAVKLTNEVDKEFPLNTVFQGCSLPTIWAAIALQGNDPVRSIDILKQTGPYELASCGLDGLYPVYVRGQARLKLGQGQQAAAEFQKILDHPGIALNFVTGALAHLQLGRAQVMMGDKAAARKSYQDFLALWKDADPDIPIYKQAKAEYAKLR